MKKIKGTKGEQEARRVTILMAARLTRSPVADAPVAVGAVHGVASVHWNLLSAALEPTTSTLVVGADWSSRAYQLSPGYSTPCHLSRSNCDVLAQWEEAWVISNLPSKTCRATESRDENGEEEAEEEEGGGGVGGGHGHGRWLKVGADRKRRGEMEYCRECEE